MEEIIKILRTEASENIKNGQDPSACSWSDQEGVLLSNGQALKIAAALEQLKCPPIVRTVLSLIEHCESNGRLNKGFDYIAVDNDGYIYEYDGAPSFQEKSWIPSNEVNYLKASIGENNIGSTLLFHRTENGWDWISNDENLLNKTT